MIGQGMAFLSDSKITCEGGTLQKAQREVTEMQRRGASAGWGGVGGLGPGTFWGGERSIGQWQDAKGAETCTAMAAGDRSTLGLDIAARAGNN